MICAVSLANFAMAAIAVASLLTLAGLWLVISGIRGRRVGSEPHCRRCNYILMGIQSPCCPECGTTITPESTRFGVRTRSWKRASLGGVLLPLAGIVGWFGPELQEVDWYGLRPTAWVIDDIGRHPRAVREIQQRMAAGNFRDSHWRRIVARGLDQQADPKCAPNDDLMDFLCQSILNGKITDEERQRFVANAISSQLSLPATVAEGEPVVFDVSSRGRLPAYFPEGPGATGGSRQYIFRISPGGMKVAVDEGPHEDVAQGNDFHGFNSGGTLRYVGPRLPLGVHRIRAELSWQISYSDFRWNKQGSERLPLGSVTHRLEARFEVVPPAKTRPATGSRGPSTMPANGERTARYPILAQTPATPVDLRTRLVGAAAIRLSWVDTSRVETGIRIERATNASFTKEVTLVGDMGPDETSYVDHLPSRTVLYHYRVYAIATTHMLNN